MKNRKRLFAVMGLLLVLFFSLNTVVLADSSVFLQDKVKENRTISTKPKSSHSEYTKTTQTGSQKTTVITTATGSSSQGTVEVKANDRSAEATFKNNDTTRGYVDRVKTQQKQELETEWYKNLYYRYESEIDKAIKKLSSDKGQGQGSGEIVVTIETLKKIPQYELVAKNAIFVSKSNTGGTIYKHVKDYYVQWVFVNEDTGEVEIYNNYKSPMDQITWYFKTPGRYTITATPYSQWDVGHYEYYDIVEYKWDPRNGTHEKHVEQRKVWVHEAYVDDWYVNARATYKLTISVDELNEPIPIPPTPTNKKVKPVTELVK